MDFEEFQKKIKMDFGFNKKTSKFEQHLHQKQPILQIIELKTLFIKEFWWEKNVKWLFTLKKHSQFGSCEFFNF